jgi:hypothetical protein
VTPLTFFVFSSTSARAGEEASADTETAATAHSIRVEIEAFIRGAPFLRLVVYGPLQSW